MKCHLMKRSAEYATLNMAELNAICLKKIKYKCSQFRCHHKPLLGAYSHLIVSPDKSQGYLGFSMVMLPPPPKRFPFGRDHLKNILVRPFKFGMWIYIGNATNLQI